MNHKPILVTGSHRSGGTWVGRMISLAEGIGYIQEPFNLDHRLGVNAYQFKTWFPYICGENKALKLAMKDCLAFRYHWFREIGTLRTVRDLGRMVKDGLRFRFHRLKGSRPLLKDPQALFSVEWLVNEFNVMPVVVIRHPAAFIGSLKKIGWKHPFHHFLQQEDLMQVIEPFRSDIVRVANKQNASIVEQGIVLWNVIHFRIKTYRDEHQDWYSCRHEDVSRNPVEEFRKIFSYLGLNFSAKVERGIRAACSGKNRSEAKRPGDIFIDSLKNIKSWKQRLTEEEISNIREGTKSIWPYFYSSNDWD